MGVGRYERVELGYPFWGNGKVEALHQKDFLQAKTVRVSAGAKTKYFRRPESYEIPSGCSNCGKSKKEVKDVFERGTAKRISLREFLERWRKTGLPLIIRSEKSMR